MSMYFLDESDDWPEYKIVKNEIFRLEKEHADILKALREAARALDTAPNDENLKAGLQRLEDRRAQVEKKLEGALGMYR